MITQRSQFSIQHGYSSVQGGVFSGTIPCNVYTRNSSHVFAEPQYATRPLIIGYKINSITFDANENISCSHQFAAPNGLPAGYYTQPIPQDIRPSPQIISITYDLTSPHVELIPYSQFESGAPSELKCLWIKNGGVPALSVGQSLGTFKATIVTSEGNTVVSPLLNLVSAEAVASTLTAIPYAPTGLYGQLSSGKVYLSWDDNSSNETSFKLYKKKTSSSTWLLVATINANLRSYVDNSPLSSLNSGDIVQYKIEAINTYGTSIAGTSNVFPVY